MNHTPLLREALRVSNRKVGILGGSFNPAHEGHLRISLLALSRLKLDELWWLVSPHNPLKPTFDMADIALRLQKARHLARHPRLHVSDLELTLGSHFTATTLDILHKNCPRTRFVWIMGADNLAQIPRWQQWNHIFSRVPIAVFDRAPHTVSALFGQAAARYRRWRVSSRDAGSLATHKPPAWTFLSHWPHPAASSTLRAC